MDASQCMRSLLLVLVAACGDSAGTSGSGAGMCGSQSSDTCLAPTHPSYRLSGPCAAEVANPTRLLVTTDDTVTGAVSVARIANRTVHSDVALSETDSLPFYYDDRVYLVHRFGFDRVDQFDAHSFALLDQFAVPSSAGNANPQGLVFDDAGLGYVPSFGVPFVTVFDFAAPAARAAVDQIDLSSYADADGVPELSLAISCGSVLFFSARRIDPSFNCTGPEILIPIDAASRQPVAGATITNLGWYARAAIQDPNDASGQTILVLTTGIERINLATGEVCWAIDEDVLVNAGIVGYQAGDFDLHGRETIYLSAYGAEFSTVDIWRLSLAGDPNPTRVISGLNAWEKTLEIVGDELWFGDTTAGGEGLRVYDLTHDPPLEVAGPISVGLPPKSMIPLP